MSPKQCTQCNLKPTLRDLQSGLWIFRLAKPDWTLYLYWPGTVPAKNGPRKLSGALKWGGGTVQMSPLRGGLSCRVTPWCKVDHWLVNLIFHFKRKWIVLIRSVLFIGNKHNRLIHHKKFNEIKKWLDLQCLLLWPEFWKFWVPNYTIDF